MKNLYGLLKGTSVALFCLVTFSSNAQSTWDNVYNILSTKCAGSGCHSGSRPGWDLSETKGEVWADLINGEVFNPTAAGNKYKQVIPGHPYKSFLLKKVADGLGTYKTSDLELSVAEGANMPDGRPALSKVEIETIRQWILAGADSSSLYENADTSVISHYYNIGGIAPVQQPTPPAAGEGFQVHLGPVFFEGNEEVEYFKTEDLFLDADIEVIGLDLTMNDESHHFILRKFVDGNEQGFPTGMYLLNPLNAFDSDKEYVMAWQDDQEFLLPANTAYFWDTTTFLDLNFHMFNYNNDILPGDVYLNVYTQPKGTAEKEMKSALENSLSIGFSNALGNIAPNAVSSFEERVNMTNKSIWTLTSHTHSRGSDFNIHLKNTDGSKGPMVYDGSYNYADGFDAGSYDWEHPPTRFWDELNTELFDTNANGQNLYNGFIYEAEYTNNTNNRFGFGFTTNDEMMIYYIQYVDGFYKTTAPVDTSDTTGIFDIAPSANNNNIEIYPNPSNDVTNVSYTLTEASDVSIEVYDLLGKQISQVINNENQPAGEYNVSMNVKALAGSSGIYIIKTSIGGTVHTEKLIIQ